MLALFPNVFFQVAVQSKINRELVVQTHIAHTHTKAKFWLIVEQLRVQSKGSEKQIVYSNLRV